MQINADGIKTRRLSRFSLFSLVYCDAVTDRRCLLVHLLSGNVLHFPGRSRTELFID